VKSKQKHPGRLAGVGVPEILCLQIFGLDLGSPIHYFLHPTRVTRSLTTVPYLKQRRIMNKSQLIEALAKQENLPLKKAEEVVNTVFGDMEKALIRGERVEIRGFGSFKVKHYDGYKGRNPKTGEVIDVAPKKLPFFKVGKELKERADVE
jgi:integration host factor subunit beta